MEELGIVRPFLQAVSGVGAAFPKHTYIRRSQADARAAFLPACMERAECQAVPHGVTVEVPEEIIGRIKSVLLFRGPPKEWQREGELLVISCLFWSSAVLSGVVLHMLCKQRSL